MSNEHYLLKEILSYIRKQAALLLERVQLCKESIMFFTELKSIPNLNIEIQNIGEIRAQLRCLTNLTKYVKTLLEDYD